jgi:hypothetical protein
MKRRLLQSSLQIPAVVLLLLAVTALSTLAKNSQYFPSAALPDREGGSATAIQSGESWCRGDIPALAVHRSHPFCSASLSSLAVLRRIRFPIIPSLTL